MKTSSESLSILLSVRNAQATLAADVQRAVDAAAELTSRFELLIVDDGSTDATEEIARELATHYAQVRQLRLPRPLGAWAALRAGLALASGDYLLMHEGPGSPSAEAITALWRSRHQGPAPGERPTGSLQLLRAWWGGSRSPRAGRQGTGTRLLRRSDLAHSDVAAMRPLSYQDRLRTPRAALPQRPANAGALPVAHLADSGAPNEWAAT